VGWQAWGEIGGSLVMQPCAFPGTELELSDETNSFETEWNQASTKQRERERERKGKEKPRAVPSTDSSTGRG
jgi:hypothetical protein